MGAPANSLAAALQDADRRGAAEKAAYHARVDATNATAEEKIKIKAIFDADVDATIAAFKRNLTEKSVEHLL